jgi:hypothetical protein
MPLDISHIIGILAVIVWLHSIDDPREGARMGCGNLRKEMTGPVPMHSTSVVQEVGIYKAPHPDDSTVLRPGVADLFCHSLQHHPRTARRYSSDMAASHGAPTEVRTDDKPGVVQAESLNFDNEKQGIATETDYSGAKAKTDPAEIALVRKLDKWIMPTLWAMYWYVGNSEGDPSYTNAFRKAELS